MSRFLLATLVALTVAGPTSAAVFFPTQTTMTAGAETGWIHVTGTTGSPDPIPVSVEMTVSGEHGLQCDGRHARLFCSNGFAFEILSGDFDPLFVLSGGDVYLSYNDDEPIDEVPDEAASMTAVILTATVGPAFRFDFRFWNQGERLEKVTVSAQVFAEAPFAAVPVPGAAGMLALAMASLAALGRRRQTGPSAAMPG